MIVEFFFIPGTTIFGIVGVVCGAVALYFAFQESNRFGYLSVLFGIIMFIIFFMIGKRMMKKSKLNLSSEITSKVNTYNENKIEVGIEGIALTDLKPHGQGKFDQLVIEVYSFGEYIEKDKKIAVLKIAENQIFIKQI